MKSPILYLDTSAWLKLYIDENGSDIVHKEISKSSMVFTHLIAYTEIRAALSRAEREIRINKVQKSQIIDALELDWKSFNIIQPVEMLIRRAALHSEQFGLRGFDSIHLASAEAVSIQVMPQETLFACFDRKLNKAASSLGMSILPLVFH